MPQAWQCHLLAPCHVAASALEQRNAVLGSVPCLGVQTPLNLLDAGGRPWGCGFGPRSNLPPAGAQGVSIFPTQLLHVELWACKHNMKLK